MALYKPSATPDSMPEMAANEALDAARRYLKRHGRDAAEIIVLVEMTGTQGEEITSGTAIGGSALDREQPAEMLLLHALLTHARMLMNYSLDGPPATPELIADLLNL